MITIGVINSKGGSGKTTLASALAVRAAKESRLVAMCDLDPQLSLVEWWRRRGACENPTIFEGVDEAADAVERAELAGYEWLFLDSPPAFLQIVQDCVQAVDFALVPIKPSMLDLLATQDTIAIAREANTPFLCVLNDVVKGQGREGRRWCEGVPAQARRSNRGHDHSPPGVAHQSHDGRQIRGRGRWR